MSELTQLIVLYFTYEFLTSSVAFTPLIVSYTIEILPFHLRAKGFNVFNFVISAALIFNQYVNPIALNHLSWKYYVCRYLVSDVHCVHHSTFLTDRVRLLARFRGYIPFLHSRRNEEPVSGGDSYHL